MDPNHRHPRCVTPPSGSAIPPDDAAIIADLRRRADALDAVLTEVKADRDGLLLTLHDITEALDLPNGSELPKILTRIRQLIEAAAGAEAGR